MEFLGKRCDHRNANGQCTECMDADEKVMNYGKSAWISPSDPKSGKFVCEPKTLKIDGFYTSDFEVVFKECLKNCKVCENKFFCTECDNPDDDLQYYPLITETPNVCVRCLPEESRFVNGDNKCETCPAGCSRCSSQSSCSVCKADFYILNLASTGLCEACPSAGYEVKDGKCLKICPDGQYRTTSNQCTLCTDTYCSKCAVETGVCTDCDSGYKLRTDTKKCWKDCGAKKYADTQTT